MFDAAMAWPGGPWHGCLEAHWEHLCEAISVKSRLNIWLCLWSVGDGHGICSGAGYISYLEHMVKELAWQKVAWGLWSCQ